MNADNEHTDPFRLQHLAHCYQGENAGHCKYGDEDCPAFIHTGDDERIDILTSLRSVVEDMDGVIDEDTRRNLLGDLSRLDALIVATVLRERQSLKLEEPA